MSVRTSIFDTDHHAYRESIRQFIEKEVKPYYQDWEREHQVDRTIFARAADIGALSLSVPAEYGGAGETDYRFRYVVEDELARGGFTSLSHGLGTHDDIVLPYFIDLANEEQRARWLPRLASGESIGAIAMTEPGAGSDLRGLRTTADRRGDHWVINGQKTFISNGIHADIVVVVARTESETAGTGFSLFVVERGMDGFSRGRNLQKVGRHAQDTAELIFEDVRVPAANLLGTEGRGLSHLMSHLPRERMMIAVSAITAAQAAYDWAVEYAFDRTAFGNPIGDFQYTRFTLADMATELEVTHTYMDRAVLALNASTLTAVDAAKAKLWTTELQKRIVDRCVQIFGGYGYMLEYPIGRSYIDTRVQTIVGGTSEIMQEIIGRDIAAGCARQR